MLFTFQPPPLLLFFFLAFVFLTSVCFQFTFTNLIKSLCSPPHSFTKCSTLSRLLTTWRQKRGGRKEMLNNGNTKIHTLLCVVMLNQTQIIIISKELFYIFKGSVCKTFSRVSCRRNKSELNCQSPLYGHLVSFKIGFRKLCRKHIG